MICVDSCAFSQMSPFNEFLVFSHMLRILQTNFLYYFVFKYILHYRNLKSINVSLTCKCLWLFFSWVQNIKCICVEKTEANYDEREDPFSIIYLSASFPLPKKRQLYMIYRKVGYAYIRELWSEQVKRVAICVHRRGLSSPGSGRGRPLLIRGLYSPTTYTYYFFTPI